jgi:hypothetical protein
MLLVGLSLACAWLPGGGNLSSNGTTLIGPIRQTGSAPDYQIVLTTRDKREWELTGPLIDELQNLIGLKLTVYGSPERKKHDLPCLSVSNYIIEDAGGGTKPEIGHLAVEEGFLYLLPQFAPDKIKISAASHNDEIYLTLKKLIGAKVWVVGYQGSQGDSLRIYRYGIIKKRGENRAKSSPPSGDEE